MTAHATWTLAFAAWLAPLTAFGQDMEDPPSGHAGEASPQAPENEVTVDDVELSSARDLFIEGRAALDAGDLALAEDRFRASLALDARGSTAMNLALVLQERDTLGEAIELYERIMSGGLGPLPADEAELALLRGHAEAGLATLTVTTGGPTAIEVSLDGELVGVVRPGVEVTLRVDPGSHEVSAAETDGSGTAFETVVMSRGGEQRVSLEVAPPEVPPATLAPRHVLSDPPESESSNEGRDDELWPYLIGGAAGAVVIAAIVAIVLVVSNPTETYRAGPFENVSALSF